MIKERWKRIVEQLDDETLARVEDEHSVFGEAITHSDPYNMQGSMEAESIAADLREQACVEPMLLLWFEYRQQYAPMIVSKLKALGIAENYEVVQGEHCCVIASLYTSEDARILHGIASEIIGSPNPVALEDKTANDWEESDPWVCDDGAPSTSRGGSGPRLH